MPPKRSRPSPSNPPPSTSSPPPSTPQNDNPHKFISTAAIDRYKDSVVTKSFIAERGFDCPGTLIEVQAERRGWHALLNQPKPALKTVVREFYANAKEHRNKKVFVRGKWIAFDRTTINKHYKLSNIDDDEYSRYRLQPNTDEVITFLTRNRVAWKTTGEDVINFPSSGLKYEKKAWHYFISATLMPTSNTSEVTKERAILNYAIQKGLSIDVGKIIETSILDWLKGGTTSGLGHASLIYALCLAEKIPTTASEEVLHPQAAITRRKMEQFICTLEASVPSSSSTPRTPPSAPRPSTAHMAAMQSHTTNQTQWQDNVNSQLANLLHRQEQLAMRQDVQFQYLSQFTTALGTMYANCGFNAGPSAVSFPALPSLPPFAPFDQTDAAPTPEDQPPEQHDDN